MKTGGLIVAAGMSSRMNAFKPMLKIGSTTIVKHIISTFRQAEIDTVVLVTGYQAETLEKHVAHMSVICLRNEAYATGEMFDSAKIGLSCLKSQCDRVLLTPVDIPLFTCRTVRQLLQAEGPVVVPVCDKREGHPLVLDTEIVEKLLSYTGEKGIAGAIAGSGLPKQLVQVEDEGILFDVDTPEEYERLLHRYNRKMFQLHL